MIRKTQVHTGDSELWREWRDMIRYGLGKPKQNNMKEELEARVLSSCRPLSEGWPRCPRSSTCHISWSDFSPGPRCYVPDPRRLESSCARILLAIWGANLDVLQETNFHHDLNTNHPFQLRMKNELQFHVWSMQFSEFWHGGTKADLI